MDAALRNARRMGGTKVLRDGTGRWSYVVFAVLLLYTHYMGSLLLAELFLAGLVLHARRNAIDRPAVSTRSWVLVHLLVALAWTPWLVAMGVRLLQRWDELSHLQHRAGLADLHLLASYLSVSASAAATWPWPVTLTAILPGVTLAILALLPYPFGSPFARLVGATVAAFITLLVGLSAITGAWIVQPRYLALVLPLALAVIASGVVLAWFQVGSVRVPLRVLALLLLGTWLISQVGGVRAFYTSPVHGRDGVREIGALLSADVQPEDIVLSNHQLLPWSISQYYSGPIQALPNSRDVRDGYLLWPTPDVLDFAPSQLAALQPLLDALQPKRVWLLYLPVMDPHKLLLSKLGEQFGKSTLQHFAYCDVYLFKSTTK